MATYRLMDGASGRPGVGSSGTQPPSSPTGAGTGNFLAGTLFSPAGEMLWFQGYWWWVPPGGDTGAQKFALWNRYSLTQQNLVPDTTVTSGTLTANSFNYVPLPAPVQLAPGALYVAATGWVVSAGFPISNNQFSSAQPYAAGITSGPLTGWSDQGGTGAFPASTGNYNLPQGVFSVAGNDPSVIMPASGSNSSNFWVDVQVSDTAPNGYTGSYRLYPNKADLGNYSLDTANNFTLGVEFSLTAASTVDNLWFYSPATVSQLPGSVGIYQVSGATLIASSGSPAWSGAAASGWVSSAALAGTSLSRGVSYKAVVLNAAGSPAIWNAAAANFWSTGFGVAGLTSGPVTAPDDAAADAPGQETYNLGAALTYPATNAGPFAYGLDIEVTPVPPPPVNYLYSMRTFP